MAQRSISHTSVNGKLQWFLSTTAAFKETHHAVTNGYRDVAVCFTGKLSAIETRHVVVDVFDDGVSDLLSIFHAGLSPMNFKVCGNERMTERQVEL